MKIVKIPFKPREYQIPLIKAIDTGQYKRAIACWHRRAGKDIALWNLLIKKALLEPGLYYYFLPSYTQSKKIIWDGINNDGFKFIDYCPKEAIASKNGTELKISLKNGSIIQLIGTDTYDAIRGTNPRGCVFSEYAFQNPQAWEVVKPILKVNGGWAVFNSTPNGKNHFYKMFKMAQQNDKWFVEKMSITDTGILNETDMQEERDEGMDEDMIQQEYYCSFDIGTKGAYYASLVEEAKKENRICDLAVEPHIPVDLFQDLGRNDSYSIGFLQKKGEEIRFIDFYEDNGKEVSKYIEYVLDMKYRIGTVYLPHDSRQKRVEAKNSVWEQWEEAGFRCKLVPKHSIDSGIAEVRKKFKRFKFDRIRCKQLISCAENYHKDWDEKAKVFRNTPKHDWCLVAGTKITTTKGLKNIEDITTKDKVLIDGVVGDITKAGYVRNSKTIIITLSDGYRLECSPEHKIFTNRGLVCADDLMYNDVVHTKNNKIWNLLKFKQIGIKKSVILLTKGLNIGYGKKESCSVHKREESKRSYIKSCGKIEQEGVQVKKRSFLLTMIGSILKKITGRSDKKELIEMCQANTNIKNFKEKDIIKQKTDTITINIFVNIFIEWFGRFIIIPFQKVIIYITLMVINLIMKLKIFNLYRHQGILKYQQKLISGLEAMQTRSNLKKIGGYSQKSVVVKLEKNHEKKSVYDLTVEKHHCYYANGLLVSNSSHAMDMVRYVAVGWEEDEIDDYEPEEHVKTFGGQVVGDLENDYSFNNF